VIGRDKRKLCVFLVMHDYTFPVRRAFDLGSKLSMMHKYAHDLPRQLDTDGELIPKHDGPRIWTENKMDIQGLMDHVDLSGLAYVN